MRDRQPVLRRDVLGLWGVVVTAKEFVLVRPAWRWWEVDDIPGNTPWMFDWRSQIAPYPVWYYNWSEVHNPTADSVPQDTQ